MLLTIAIHSHNKASFLQSALESIILEPEFGQEVDIVISDNSLNSDIKKLYNNKYIDNRFINRFNSREYKCLDSNVNRAVHLSTGEYVWIFGDDDLIVPGVLSSLIPFLKDKVPDLVVLNSKSFKGSNVIEQSRLPAGIKYMYLEDENDNFLIDMAGYLTYVGGILVRKDLWKKYFDYNNIGTFFAHIACISSIKIGRRAHYFSRPSIQMRLGSQTWTSKSFIIWNRLYPNIIWNLENYSIEAKNSVIIRNPIGSLKTMFAARAYGRLNYSIWLKVIKNSVDIKLRNKSITLFLSLMPRFLFSLTYILLILLYKRKHIIGFSPKLALAQLKIF